MRIVSRSILQSVVVGEFDGFERVLKVTVREGKGGRASRFCRMISAGPAKATTRELKL